MHLKTAAVGCLVASTAFAQDAFDEIVSKKDTKPSKSYAPGVDHPAYTPYDESQLTSAVVVEQFQDESASQNWKPSNAKKDDEFSYVGKWAFEEPSVLPGFEGDKGMVMKSPAAHHAISRKLAEPLDNTDKTLVLQYEVKLQKGLECGGAYVKLLSENEELHADEFSSANPYQVMFGPDKCGSTNKVHFIIRRKSPVDGTYEEKHLTMPPPARLNKLTNLYTLIIHPDQQYEIRINGKVVKSGSLLREGVLNPSLNPPKEVVDENDVKPADWVDEKEIPDPEHAEKPADWDEDAPMFIPDPDVEKPADWDEDTPDYIDDPEAEKPIDWDDEEDGEWVAPQVKNPACKDHGCGPWEAPLIKNPDYKGKWVQPKIPNPDYKGEWQPRKIANPNYYEDSTPSNLEPIGAIGLELWTMQSDILFDNFYLGHSVEDAEQFANATFVPKLKIETAEEEALAPPPTPKKDPKQYESALDFFRDDPLGYIKEVYRVFILNFSINAKQAVIDQPIPAFFFGVAAVLVMGLMFGTLNVILYFMQKLARPQEPTGKAPVKTAKDDSGSTGKTTSSSKSSSAAKRRA